MRLAFFALTLAATVSTTFAAGKETPKPSVIFAKTWDAAVEEARLLNVPIVLHSHGFYCPPCWGMHSSLLQNKKYIDFADRWTVEVISLSRLDEGIERGDRKASTYTDKDGKEYLLEWPNLTVEDVNGLRTSKASSYNDTGKIPFTAVIDPWTLEEVQRWSGGQAASTIMDTVKEHRKQLVNEHGEGIRRTDLRELAGVEAEVEELIERGEYGKAIAAIEKVSIKSANEWPQDFTARLTKARESVVAAAETMLAEIEAKMETDAAEAKRELGRVRSKLRGTGLEERALNLSKAL